MERDDVSNVVYAKCRASASLADHDAGHCSVLEWTGRVGEQAVDDFVRNERRHEYNIFGKNCQHLAYDFFRNVLQDGRACGSFESFSPGRHALAFLIGWIVIIGARFIDNGEFMALPKHQRRFVLQ